MRLNFSGVDEDQIREGIQRLGEVVREQVALYGTLTGEHPVRRPRPSATAHAARAGAGGARRARAARERPAAAAQARVGCRA